MVISFKIAVSSCRLDIFKGFEMIAFLEKTKFAIV